MPSAERDSKLEGKLHRDVRLLGRIVGDTLREQEGEASFALVEELRRTAVSLRRGTFGREAFAKRIAALDLDQLELVARAVTQYFQLTNAAEEQHRIRTLRLRDRPGAPPEGSLAAAAQELARMGASAADVDGLLRRLLVMPVLTAHPTEARRWTVLDHLSGVSAALDGLDDPRAGTRTRAHLVEQLREAVLALHDTEEARAARPSPFDEVRTGLYVFERTLFDVTPMIYRELEAALGASYPGRSFAVGPFLRWGSWIGGDRDGNPRVTAEVTRFALERQRRLALARHLRVTDALGRTLSISARRVSGGAGLGELEASLARDRDLLPEVAASAARYRAEPWREKMRFVRARLEATRGRGDGAFSDSAEYVDELRLLERCLTRSGLTRLGRGPLADAIRLAEVFGFHLATLDLRQDSGVHEAAVAELLERGGVGDYQKLPEQQRTVLLASLLERADLGVQRDRARLSQPTRELLSTLDVVGRARRDQGPLACERYVISFTSAPSDVLEVLFLARAANLTPDELRPVPLLEQIEDLASAESLAARLLALSPVRVAPRGELEVMLGYSDSGKQAGYLASAVALEQAQEALARVADAHGVVLTVFHGRGGAVGRGGGPAGRAIRAQPPEALRGRFRVTEQGETITARYGRCEIAQRDLEQMISAVLLASLPGSAPARPDPGRQALLRLAATRARSSYDQLLADPDRLARYATTATPIEQVAELPIASRPAARRTSLSFKDLRAIPWVFSWNQSRHGIPGWFGLGAGLEAIVESEGVAKTRRLYQDWPLFRALIDNAQLALARADIEVAEFYARLADADARTIFALIRAEHARTVARVLEVTGQTALLSSWPTLLRIADRRNPYVDILSHAQITLLERIRGAEGAERLRMREILFTTINGIAAGLQTAG